MDSIKDKMNCSPYPGGLAADFEEIDYSQPQAWYFPKTKTYWVRNNDFDWIGKTEQQFKRYLVATQGLCPKRREDEIMSEVDQEIFKVEHNNRLGFVGALAGWRKGVQQFQGQKALITSELKLLQPRPGDWTTLKAVIENLLNGDIEQAEFFYYWLKHTMTALYEGRPARGLCLVLAGDPGCGKSLLVDILKEMMGNRCAFPYRNMIGKDNFNAELFESPLLVVDDENANTKMEARLCFGAEIKQIVAKSEARCRGMNKEAMTLQPLWRLVICLNLEPDRLMVLPPIDDDIADKLLILKAHKKPLPMPSGTEDQKCAFFNRIKSELPAFLDWLFLECNIPEEMSGRFGVKAFQHPQVLNELYSVSPEHQLLVFIDQTLFPEAKNEFEARNNEWKGSADDLFRELMNSNALEYHEVQKVAKMQSWIGRRLAKLRDKFPDRFEKTHTKEGNFWNIYRKGWVPEEVTA